MGAEASKPSSADQGGDNRVIGRAVAITGGAKRGPQPRVPQNAKRAAPEDHAFIEVRVLAFTRTRAGGR
jgi:hypothetical protein